ncbi:MULTISPECIES: DUF3794 and LysM peptidoglycan-binding domain-containing protein [Lachnospiraceae]|jgi:hypothetical protein|uniref:DUF3794 domain-containing protein n=1 Tax=Faecalicatena acetigenes TaxID=2981790 RepID=A0ABT2TB69_9FIRM|nr:MULTISPECIES: SPOCS domain-containing protein [Lachnospiraceae]MCU6747117.1 DUF3794 domain-containing protein [Faecalicatena acetigenes]RGT74166.1 DUF3794 domain-containing protein [Ruminococcus sp. AF18-22]SCH66522.1 autolysin [uncultured Clostridium sp.]
MELIKKQIHYNQEGKHTFDQFVLDEDYNVPDAKEDVRQIIQNIGTIKVEDIRMVENYIRVTGKFYFQILYLTDAMEARPGVLEGKLPFEEMVYAENEEGANYYIENIRDEFTVSVVNSRKIGLHVMIEMEIGKEKLEDEETTVDAESTVPIYKKMKSVNLLKLNTTKKDTYRIKEEITLPGTKESIGVLLVSSISSRKLEIRPEMDALLIKGELLVFCLYLSEDEKTDWIEQSVPFEGRLACDGVEEGMYYHVQHTLEDTLVDVRMDEDGEMRILGIEGTINLRLNIYEEEEMELLADMYALEKKCEFETREVVYEELLMQNHSKCKIGERLELPELKDNVLQICHSEGNIQTEHIEKTDEGLRIEGILHLSFLYLRADDNIPFGSWQGMIPFSYLMECPGIPEDVRYNLSYHVEQLLVTLAGSEAVEVKAVLAFDVFLRKPIPMQVITEAHLIETDAEAMENRPGIVGYIVKAGDELWDLAKTYMTTVEGIKEVNALESDTIKAGDKLLIFKENMSIL